jgi:hypothetical protein
MRKPENLTLYYIYLAVACGTTGIILTFAVLFVCEYYNVNITKNLWVLAIPITLSLFLNISLVELLRWFRRR